MSKFEPKSLKASGEALLQDSMSHNQDKDGGNFAHPCYPKKEGGD